MNPTVSTVITTYNNAPFLEDALNSVLSQGLGDRMEVIVVDDGSTDNTVDVMSDYLKRVGDNLVRYIRQTNGGPAKARNSGVQAAKGKYIAFLDADDLWMPGKLKKALEFMESHSDIGLLFTDLEEFDDKGETFSASFFKTRRCEQELRRNWQRLSDPFSLTLRECVILLSTCLIRADCFKKIGLFDEDYRNGEDMDILLRLSAVYPVACLPEVTVRKRAHDRNISGNRAKVMWAILRVLDRMETAYPDRMRQHRASVNAQRAEVNAEAGYHLFEAQDFGPAFKHSLAGFRYRPDAKTFYYAAMSFIGMLLGRRLFARLRSLKQTLSSDRGND